MFFPGSIPRLKVREKGKGRNQEMKDMHFKVVHNTLQEKGTSQSLITRLQRVQLARRDKRLEWGVEYFFKATLS